MPLPRWAAAAVLAPMAMLFLVRSSAPPTAPSPRRAAGAIEAAARSGSADPIASRPIALPARRDPSVAPGAAPSAIDRVPDAAAAAPAAGRDPASPRLPSPFDARWAQGKFAHFTTEELHELAARCELRWQLPPFSADELPSFDDDGERDAYLETLGAERTRHTEALRALHAELTGDRGPDELRLLADTLRVHPDGDGQEIRARLARRLAGEESGEDRRVHARFLAEELSAGDRFEQALARRLDPARAAALRGAAGPRHTLTGCDDARALYRSER